MTQYDLGQVVGADGQDGVDGSDGSTIWYTSTAPTYANSKYTFTISNLSGKTGFTIAVNDLIFYDTYYYIVSTVNSTTVDCATRVSIKGSDASVTVVDNLNSDSSTSVLSAKQGKVLNTNKIETSAIATSFGSTTSDSKVPSEKLVQTELDKKIATSSTTGLLKNDGSVMTGGTGSSNWAIGNHTHSNYISTSSTTGLIKNDGSIDSNSYLTTSSASSTYQTKLVSGTSIKTINNESLLGSGNITIQGGSSVDIVTAWETTPSDSKVASEKLVKDSLDGKLDNAVTSTAITIASNDNILVTDYSDSNKVKRVANILASQVKDSTAHTNIGSSASDTQASINSSIDTALSNKVSKSSTSGLLKNDGTVDTTSYSTFSGSYNDLSNKPSIPSKTSDLNNDSNFISTSNTTGLIKNDGTIDTSSYLTSSALSGYQTTANLVTSFSSTTSDSKYPSEKLTKTELDKKIAKSSTSGLVKNDGSIDTNTYLTSSAITGMLTSSDIANNLTTTTTGKVLDASQGKALADLIGQAISYINQ